MDPDDSQDTARDEPRPVEPQNVVLTPDTIAEVLRRVMIAAPELEDQIRAVFEPSESGAPLRSY